MPYEVTPAGCCYKNKLTPLFGCVLFSLIYPAAVLSCSVYLLKRLITLILILFCFVWCNDVHVKVPISQGVLSYFYSLILN